jgi:transcriptional regulator with XRE-family HTH domain
MSVNGSANSTSKPGEETIRAQVATARHEAGLTQKQLAERLDVSLWMVERFESGDEEPVERLEELARATGKPTDWFTLPDQHQERPVDRPTETEPATRGSGLALVLASFTVLIVIRFFTEVLPVLPRAANFVDIPIFFALVFAGCLRPAPARTDREDAGLFLIPALFFLLICAVATLANPSRVEAAPVLVFVYGYLAPIGVFAATYRIWPVGSSLSLSRLIVGLGFLQLVVVALIDLPRFFATNNPDEISGTLGTNGYQLVFFLLLVAALLAGIFTFERHRRTARVAPALFVAILATIFLVQYRSLILTMALTVVLIAAVLGSASERGKVFGAVAIAAFIVTLAFTAQALPFLRLAPAVGTYTHEPTAFVSDRARAFGHVAELYNDNPRYIVTGTGPGTYASRAWQTFGLVHSSSKANVAGPYAARFTGGKAYHTDVSDKYVRPRVQHGEVIQGSYAVTLPYSDYSSLLAEVGLFGFATLVFIYLVAFMHSARMTLIMRRRPLLRDPLPALAVATTSAFFVLIQMGILQSWLEVTRITFPSWILLAVVTKEFRSRYGTERAAVP